MSRLDIDMTEFKEFFGKMEQFAKGQFKEELIEYVDTIGFDFLRVVQDEIVRRKVIDTRLLLASFEKGSAGNIWEIADGGLTLEVGTNVEYSRQIFTRSDYPIIDRHSAAENVSLACKI